ncbi:MAG: AEC family transporter [Gammaproteobacteria bacterium]
MSVIEALFPVIAIAALGYLVRVREWISGAEAAAIERIAFWFLIPCLLFLGTATADFPADIDWRYLFAFYVTVLLVYGAGMALGRALFGFRSRELAVFGMGGAYSNVTVLGIPITVELLGDSAFVPMLLVITFHNLVLYTSGTMLAAASDTGGKSVFMQVSAIVREMALNPISSSLLAGAAWNLLDLPTPALLVATLELLTRAAVPGAIFALGAALTRYHIRGGIAPALCIVVMKLVVLPLAMWQVMTRVFDIHGEWMQAAVLLCCMPVGISVYVFSRRYESGEAAVATAIVMSSVLTPLTLSLMTTLIL